MAEIAAQWPHAVKTTAAGVALHYVDVGPRDALPVVLVHGWPDLWFGWRHQIAALAPDYRLIVPDLRGFGQSSTPQNAEAYGAKKVTSDLAALLDALEIPRAVFVGHDWGGAMVWRMCLYHPKRVLAVGAVCTPYTPPSDRYIPLDVVVRLLPQFAYQEVLADAEATGKRLDAAPRRFFTAIFRSHTERSAALEGEGDTPVIKLLQGVSDSSDPTFTQRSSLLSEEELQYYVDQYTRSKFRSTCQYYATREIDFKDEQGLPTVIEHPALFIAAADDNVLKPEMAHKMPSVLPNLEMHVVKQAGHWVLWEKKEEVNTLLKAWLAKISPLAADKSSKL